MASLTRAIKTAQRIARARHEYVFIIADADQANGYLYCYGSELDEQFAGVRPEYSVSPDGEVER